MSTIIKNELILLALIWRSCLLKYSDYPLRLSSVYPGFGSGSNISNIILDVFCLSRRTSYSWVSTYPLQTNIYKGGFRDSSSSSLNFHFYMPLPLYRHSFFWIIYCRCRLSKPNRLFHGSNSFSIVSNGYDLLAA